MLRTYRYRLYPTNAQTRTLDFLLWQGRTVYNAALAQRVAVYKETGEGVNSAQQWAHFRDQRRDFWHKLTRDLTDTYSVIALEDLTLKFMTANRRLALSAHDASLGEFQQLLQYKAESAGTEVVTVNPAYTSQVCSGCGAVVEKALSVRDHRCPHCGLTLDRDVNAARNVLSLAVESARTGRSGANVARWGERSLRSSLL